MDRLTDLAVRAGHQITPGKIQAVNEGTETSRRFGALFVGRVESCAE